MASPPTTEASEIRRRGRQRLIGAVALVAILVVFVPMVLDSEPRPQRPDNQLAIPSKTDAPPLPAPPKAAPAPVPAKVDAPAPKATENPPKVASVDTAPAKGATPESNVLQPRPPKSAERASPPPPEPAAPPKLVGFAVQVGAFRDEAKLAQARQRVVGAKIPHYTERLEAQGGPLTRLRAGPFPTREAAESALAALKLAAVDGKVVPLP
jgi:DedD protein